jgi:hypothetical protein
MNGGHGAHYELDSASFDPRLASMPKGTLPLRHMTSRQAGQYNPEKVQTYDTRKNLWDIRGPQPSVSSNFYTPANRLAIVNAVVNVLNKNGKGSITADQLPASLVDESMRRSFEVFGQTSANAPAARTGPSESLPWRAKKSKYQDDWHSTGVAGAREDDITTLNKMAARRLKEQIVSERALLSRYQRDLGGAIHVLEYPKLPPEDQSRHHALIFRDYDDISSQPGDGRDESKMLRGPGFGGKR